MRGVSQESFARAEEAMAAAAPDENLGSELYSLAQLLDRSASLRRALTDPGRPTGAKAGLAEQLLRGKVSDGALAVMTAAVSGRWSASRDLADALETLSVTADIAYADDSGRLDEVEDELFRLERVLATERGLREKLADRSIDVPARQGLLRGLLEGRADRTTIRLAERAVAGRGMTIGQALAAYQEAAAARRNARIATVRVASDLSEDERRRLAAALSRQYGRDIQVNVVVDPSVLGGVRIDIAGEVIDGTVAARLDDAQRRIAG